MCNVSFFSARPLYVSGRQGRATPVTNIIDKKDLDTRELQIEVFHKVIPLLENITHELVKTFKEFKEIKVMQNSEKKKMNLRKS